LHTYGETYEHRPLIYVVVSSSENIKNIEQIRNDNLRRAGMEKGNPSTKKAIVWMSYNVHGNEASGVEAALRTLYEVANPENKNVQHILNNLIIVFDPCLNPDGRDRYVNFYRQYGNVNPNTARDAFEHHEPWPGGRSNHYLHDLNRDWAWLTQQESQRRIEHYNQWMPQVHIDFHEQGYNNPYYFAPAAAPYHEVLTPWQQEFQKEIGKNNAKYFDAQGWLYFTREIFDLYYPSYGDTYPSYNGAIGMTYEQAGSGWAGLSITTQEGDPLTLYDRMLHHYTSGMATLETIAKHADKVISEFEHYFKQNSNQPIGTYKTYVIKETNNKDKIKKLTQWLDHHNIEYGHPAVSKPVRGFDYQKQTTSTIALTNNDIIFTTYQPKSRFITSVFEPFPKLPDSLTYDITGWSLFYAHNVEAYALTEKITIGKRVDHDTSASFETKENVYAYLFKYETTEDVKFLAELFNHGFKVRASLQPFTVGGQSFDAGTLIVTRRNNEGIVDFDHTLVSIANEYQRNVYTTSTGFVEQGKDFGSSYIRYINRPEVAVVFGDQTWSLSAGEVWHYFEQEINYPITQLSLSTLRNTQLSNYDVLIFPEGWYSGLEATLTKKIYDWVQDGGRLILIGRSIQSFSGKDGFHIESLSAEEKENQKEKKAERNYLKKYGDAERADISDQIIGAIYQVQLDKTHPLAFGLGDRYFSLKTNESRYAFLDNGWNVGVINGKAKPVQGFAGHNVNKKFDNSLVMGVQSAGEGNIIYFVDNPLFRSFWQAGKMAFSNAVFLVGE
jgi:hypothetical protein